MAKELLTDAKIRATKPTIKDIRLFDGNGLYLLIKSNDSKWWRIDYTINKTRKTLSLGTYPYTSLSDARKKAFELKKLVSEGIDPSEVRKATREIELTKQIERERASNGLPPVDSFKVVSDEWFEKRMQQIAKRRAKLSRVLGKRALKSFHPRLFNDRLFAGESWSDKNGYNCRNQATAFC